MSLKLKVIAITLFTFLLSASLDYGIQKLVIIPNFHELEREETTKNVFRVIEAINRELQLVSVAVSDWAYWDLMYQYALEKTPEFLESTLNETALEAARVNLLNVYDTTGSLVWGRAISLDSDESLELGALSEEHMSADHPLLVFSEVTGEAAGIIATPKAPLLVVAKPILTNERKGPAAGTFMLGRLLDEQAVNRIGEQTKLPFSVLPYTADAEGESWSPSKLGSLPHSSIHLNFTDNLAIGQTVIGDVFGRPLLTLRISTPRAIASRGESAMNFALMSICFAGTLVTTVLLFMLHCTVLRPLGKLTNHAIEVGTRGDLRTRLAFSRKDEIGILAREFDTMTERLSEARRNLVDQSYHSGIAEMASGVLHNIGNAVTPLNVRLASLQGELNEAPAEELTLALTELESGTVGQERRKDLAQFVELAAMELAGLVDRMRGELSLLVQQVSHVQQILSDQERYSRAARVLEPIEIERVIREAAEMLSPEMQRGMLVELAPSVSQVGEVLASRVVVQQLLTNILVNAAESILSTDAGKGRMVVTADEVQLDGTRCGHFCFEDDGVGIHTGDLKHIFERNFSTKNRGSGRGLHWCSNTINALNGRLYAESDGPGRGFSMHLILPLAGNGGNGRATAADKFNGA